MILLNLIHTILKQQGKSFFFNLENEEWKTSRIVYMYRKNTGLQFEFKSSQNFFRHHKLETKKKLFYCKEIDLLKV